MFLGSILGVFIASQAILSEKPASYHDQLLAMCSERAAPACCRASVRAMRSEQARLYNADAGCPQGTQRTSLSCPASLQWCTREVGPHKGRLDDLSSGKY